MRRTVSTSRGELRLSENECALLNHLVRADGGDVSREELYREVWGYADAVRSRAVDLAVTRLRKKIEQHASDPDHLLTVYGVGYRFVGVAEAGGAPDRLVAGEIVVDLGSGTLQRAGVPPTPLAASEARALALLATGIVVSPADLGGPDAARTTIRRVRRRVEVDPASPRFIGTVRGRGYRWVAGPAVSAISALPWPTQPGPTRGRAALLLSLRERIGPIPLVLVAAGGVGKTRLAVELARWWHGWAAGHRVVWVDAVGAQTAPDLAAALASALGREARSPTLDALAVELARALGPSDLVVLDNVEQVAEHVPQLLSRLRHQGPVVVTSRVTLDDRTVHHARIEPLDHDAARALFSDRAPAAAHHPELAALLRTLGWVPLAIELAAARTSTLTVDVLAAQYQHCLASHGPRPAHVPARQHAMVAVFRTSWALLTPRERDVARSVALFASPTTADRLAAVVGLASEDCLHALIALSDKSLVRAHTAADDLCFDLHVGIREFILDGDAPDAEVFERYLSEQARQARHFANSVRGPEGHLLLPALRRVAPDLVQAARELLRRPDERLGWLVLPLTIALRGRWPLDALREIYSQTIEAVAGRIELGLESRLWQVRMQTIPVEERASDADLRHALALAKRSGDTGIVLQAHATWAANSVMRSDLEGAARHARAAIALSHELPAAADAIFCYYYLSLRADAVDDVEESLTMLDAGIDRAHRDRDRYRIGPLLTHRAQLLVDQGRYAEARLDFEERIASVHPAMADIGTQVVYARMCLMHLDLGSWADARRAVERALSISQRPSIQEYFRHAIGAIAEITEHLANSKADPTPRYLRRIRDAERAAQPVPLVCRAGCALSAEPGLAQRQARAILDGKGSTFGDIAAERAVQLVAAWVSTADQAHLDMLRRVGERSVWARLFTCLAERH